MESRAIIAKMVKRAKGPRTIRSRVNMEHNKKQRACVLFLPSLSTINADDIRPGNSAALVTNTLI